MGVEDRELALPDKRSPRAIDWSAVGGFVFEWTIAWWRVPWVAMFSLRAVGGFVFEWTIAIGEYVFIVLLVGLAGGYVGTFADLALSWLNDDWVGHGRAWGWILGAASAAIGLPLGWVRRDDKKFSFPSPRALRKKASSGLGKARKNKNLAHDFRTVGDVLKGGGLGALVGAVLGFFLGGVLAISWFSLAMSPFASAEWFESLEFNTPAETRDHPFRHTDDARGHAISTDNPIAIYLWFTPVLVLCGVAAVAGTAYGAVEYARYVTSVPAGVREEQRRKKRRPLVDEAQAAAAAIEQGLPVLASPPRRVPLPAQWQLLRGGAGFGLVIGVIFFAAGLVFLPLLVLGWRHDPTQMPLVAVTFAIVFVGIGLMALTACLRIWRRDVAILRRGYLARCRILECKDANLDRWKPYATLVEELRRAWHKPIAEVATQVTTKSEFSFLGLRWGKTVTNGDVKSFQRFGTFAGWFVTFVLGFMGLVGVVLTGGTFYSAIVQGEPVAWFGLLFLALWWIVIVLIGRSFLQQLKLFKTLDKQSMSTLGIEPLLECRVQFTLPNGKDVRFETKLDLSPELAGNSSASHDVAVYDPMKPQRALLLRQFSPPLDVDDTGQWRLS